MHKEVGHTILDYCQNGSPCQKSLIYLVVKKSSWWGQPFSTECGLRF